MPDPKDSLKEYRKKRDPGVTNEPFAAASGASASETWVGDFVVHLHAATRRHYDLRIQIGEVLLSFAVPRGPSLDPADKRLAVQTEDHPFEYLDFEDIIPDGSYGAGPMIVWDLGRIQYLNEPPERGLDVGKLDFLLFGHKLRGRFALVETTGRGGTTSKQRQWLLLKKQDVHCVPDGDTWLQTHGQSVLSGLEVEQLAQRPEFEAALVDRARQLGATEGSFDFPKLVPTLCAPNGAELVDPARLYELKLDGVRILGQRKGEQVQLKYRKPHALTNSYPDIERALRSLFARDFVIDGEIVAFNERGSPKFQLLAPRIHAKRPLDVKRAVSQVPVVFMVFDLLALGPLDLTSLPLVERKSLLADLVRGKGLVRYLDHLPGNGAPLFALAEQERLEGVVSKVAQSRYSVGVRSPDWVKHKCRRETELVVVGWIEGKGSRDLGALELASYREGQLVYRGRVGGGMSDAMLAQLQSELAEIARDEPLNVEGLPETPSARHWVEPRLVVRVEYLEWSLGGNLRMPIFKDLLRDVEPASCDDAPPEELVELQRPQVEVVAEAPAPRRVQLTNRDKVFWPREGITKGDMLDYYAGISDVLLPHLADRPIMLVRYPDGIEGKNFYQWNTPKGTPSWVRTLSLKHEERDGKDVTTFLVDDVDALLHVINLGCIPIHVLASRKESLQCCDFLTIDFDLGDQPFREAVLMALGLKDLLEEVGLEGYPKTSGQSGLHVLIPMGPGIPFAIAKALVELLGRLLQTRFPETSTMERRISERGGRAYIDTGQTGRSRTIVAPYSVRAHPGATVSTPLSWDEVHLALKPEVFTLFTVVERAQQIGDPMLGLLSARPNVLGAVQQLEHWVKRGS